MSYLRAVPPKLSNWELALALEELLKVVPMVESQRDLVKDAAERIKYQDD